MQPTSPPIWRRDAPVSAPSRADVAPLPTSKLTTSKARPSRKSTSQVTLLPITPLHEIAPGAIDVDAVRARVVYLAPLTYTAAEKYFARTKGQSAHGTTDSSEEEDALDDALRGDKALTATHGETTKNQQSPSRSHVLSPVNALLTKLLADHDRRLARHRAKQDKLCATRASVFDQRSSYNDIVLVDKRTIKAKPRKDRQEDDQIERLKRSVHSIPTTAEAIEAFQQTIKTYQRLQMEYRALLMRNNHASPVGSNMEAAWNRQLLDERHRLWVQVHDEHLEATRARKVQEDENHERRIQETTTEHRTHMRLLREVRLRFVLESQLLLPTVALAAVTQHWFEHLERHWRHEQLSMRLRGIIRCWCKQRKSRSFHVHAAHLLIHWLQKSVAVKSVAFRVFRGIRNYVRRVKKIQRLWKVKRAKRLRNCLQLHKLWIEQETSMVDQANDEFEKKLPKGDVKPVRSKKKSASKPLSPRHSNAGWLTFVSPDIRLDVIEAYVRAQEVDFTRRFRHQEEDLYPQLVQTLRDENPNKARSYIKAVANGYALLGRVFVVLSQFAGAVVNVVPIEPFDVKGAPIQDLILSARDQSAPDETGARFGTLDMQNDATAAANLLHGASEDKKKQILAFLQRRQHVRSQHRADPATESPVTLSALPTIGEPGEKSPPNADDIHHEPRDTSAKTVPAELPQNALDFPPKALSPLDLVKPRPQVAFALVVVCCTFRFLPPLADKTKEIANQLFYALTDSHFGRFSCRGSKLLINPSVIEFQDTMKELAKICSETSEDASFFLCFASHGARVTSGVNEGSYVLFSETRISSEEELLLTALHENDLAKMIHDIPCKNKLLALELCQVHQAKDKPTDEAPTIVNRIHEAFASRLFNQLINLALSKEQKTQPSANQTQLLSATSPLFNTVILESCIVKQEAPVRSPTDGVSNFLHRLNDAYHGAAAHVPMDSGDEIDSALRSSFRFRNICSYVKAAVENDAKLENNRVKAEYTKQLRTKYELVAEFEDIMHTPQLVVFDRFVDFTIGDIPAAPDLAPSPPQFVSATPTSVTLSWSDDSFVGYQPTTSIEVPTILGFHLEIRGDGRACDQWRRISDFQVLSFDEAFREKTRPPTQVTVHGLPCDLAFRFRIRARSAGGWGPFSDQSPAFRTRSYASVRDTFSTVDIAFRTRGVLGLYEMMETNSFNRDVLRTSIEFLARVAVKAHEFPSTLVVLIVHRVVQATQKFSEDAALARGTCLFIGHLAVFNDLCRKAMLSVREPHGLSETLEQIASRFATTHAEISSTALWATARLHGAPRRQPISRETAARRIQGMYRTRKATAYVRSLASAVYTQLVDPSTGRYYFYNATTGATTWSLPSFLTG